MATRSKSTTKSDPLAPFSPATRRWFEASFEGPTPAQVGGWEAIAGGDNALICAPTGSGKTLASFLWGIDKLAREPELGTGVKLVYISPLKALSYDIERNLRAPLRGIGADISVGLRTGDTPQKDRRAMAKTPPDILITTPESLYLMMSSSVREILTGVEAVIVDEIHAVAQTKRGSHLSLTLERLDHLVRNGMAGEGSGDTSPEQQRGGSGEASPEVASPVVARVEAFREALADDFNTPRAMAEVFELVGEANRADDLPGASVAVAEMLELVGLASLAESTTDGADEGAAELMVEREAARAAKDFARADAIRDELAALGYEVRDSAEGPRLVPKS